MSEKVLMLAADEMLIVLNPPVSFPIIVNNALPGVEVDFARTMN